MNILIVVHNSDDRSFLGLELSKFHILRFAESYVTGLEVMFSDIASVDLLMLDWFSERISPEEFVREAASLLPNVPMLLVGEACKLSPAAGALTFCRCLKYPLDAKEVTKASAFVPYLKNNAG